MRKEMGKSIPTADFDSGDSVEEKRCGNWSGKENASPLVSGTSFAGTPGAFLTFTARYKQLPGYPLPQSKEDAQNKPQPNAFEVLRK